jgi:hypothetical protein
VCSRKGKLGGIVIEGGRTPSHRRMAFHTIVIELTCYVVGIGCSVKISGMTIPARVRKVLILVVHVTLVARRCNMRSCEGELRVVVTER